MESQGFVWVENEGEFWKIRGGENDQGKGKKVLNMEGANMEESNKWFMAFLPAQIFANRYFSVHLIRNEKKPWVASEI